MLSPLMLSAASLEKWEKIISPFVLMMKVPASIQGSEGGMSPPRLPLNVACIPRLKVFGLSI